MIEISWEDLDEDVKALLTVSDVWEQPMPRVVPHPCAQVDLAEAWSEAQIDARAVKIC